jgi:hypothetical protein
MMANARMRRPATALVAAILVSVASDVALAKGSFKGRFGHSRFKAKTGTVACRYTQSIAFLDLNGIQNVRGGRVRRFAGVAGTVADPSAPGTAFPIALTDAIATFGTESADPNETPLWTGTSAGGLVVTLTGYKRGKVTGTVRGTLQPLNAAAPEPMDANASFTAKCAEQ